MAAALATLLSLILSSSAAAAAAVLDPAPEQASPSAQPHLTDCVSRNMETFRCRWNVGDGSEPGDLRLFYMNKKSPHASPKDWSECPDYSSDRPNECFFNENHTTIWTPYIVQLRSRDQAILYDEKLFLVHEIVQPDPPVGLNWTLLNVSLTSSYYDVLLSWRPPQSADVQMGWMRLEYEVQYRDVSSENWKVISSLKSTHSSLYGLQTNVNHEIRVRCKMLGGEDFGEFSESTFVHVPTKVSRFPVVALLLFGALCLVAILMLFIISQQQRLMVILLPPVPGPKIRGIDPELLKKGKLRELTSILGGPPDLRPELYNNDPWVEFIDLDIEEQSDRLTDLDKDCFMHCSTSSNCTPLSISFRDDDSGRASCCDPDLTSDPEASPLHPLVQTEIPDKETTSCLKTCEPGSPPQSPVSVESPFVVAGKEVLYTQVTEVAASGKVLLSPEEPTKVEKTSGKDAEKDIMAEKEKEKKELWLQVVNPDQGGYTSELNVGKVSLKSSTGDVSEPWQTVPAPSPCSLQEEDSTTPASPLSPAPIYTVVEAVDMQNSLLLTPSSAPAPQLIIPKTVPTPDGYLTPDLLGSITP